MKIGLIGHYGADEYCDDYLEILIRKTFDNISKNKTGNLIQWIRYPTKTIPDAIILGGGSILGVNYGIKNILQNTNIPFYIFSPGFREIATYDIDKFKYLIERASYIAVRGYISIQKLNKLGFDTSKIEIVGDPIFLCNGKQNIINSSLTTPQEKFIGGIYRPYITQEDKIKEIFNYLSSTRNEKIKMFSFSKVQGDIEGGKKIGSTVENLNNLETYKEMIKSSFWFGNRLHPFCISLIHGIPTIGLDIEFNKVESVCSTLDYPYWIDNNNLNLDTFKNMYEDLIENHEMINIITQKKINKIRTDLNLLAEKIFNDILIKIKN